MEKYYCDYAKNLKGCGCKEVRATRYLCQDRFYLRIFDEVDLYAEIRYACLSGLL